MVQMEPVKLKENFRGCTKRGTIFSAALQTWENIALNMLTQGLVMNTVQRIDCPKLERTCILMILSPYTNPEV